MKLRGEFAMTLHDFKIGNAFWTRTGEWRCTDIGTRVVVAIRLDQDDPTWYNGPPYAVAETVFDEDDLEVCFASEAEMLADYSDVRDQIVDYH